MKYNQEKTDKEFEALIKKARRAKLKEIVTHFENRTGMGRVEPVRFLKALFAERERMLLEKYTFPVGLAIVIITIVLYVMR